MIADKIYQIIQNIKNIEWDDQQFYLLSEMNEFMIHKLFVLARLLIL